ncbi:MAG: tRNA (adenosine(37)-N6)-threonylcarbamoyltransferase complex transferase subunit TsaD [Rickettsiales bacterium]|jgi:N6-L-threonylcarbamoyladenine synthase|nr:tRNA (adenosine(37)-N6)-threonylcarbamoyltransferase complex transferase subunit TsaD [Rickettsiales bacterium]
MKILGIESSCDETAIAIVNDNRDILANNIVSQIDIHKVWGGVIPEVASRNHLDVIDKVIEKTLQDANLTFVDIDAIATTTGPGLMGGLLVGALMGQTLSSVLKKPFIPVNHLEGHLLTTRLTNNIQFPFLTFLISGGHTQIILANGIGDYKKIGETIDDSLGECFDKVGQMLGLEYPAGPKIEQLAKNGDENRYKFVKPLINAIGKGVREEHKYNFSFSGLKTAVRLQTEKMQTITEQDKCDISASFQKTVLEILQDRFKNVLITGIKVKNLVFAGGVSANQYIKNGMKEICAKYNMEVMSPPIKLCTDNGVMVAWAGLERYKLGLYKKSDILEIKANWEL